MQALKRGRPAIWRLTVRITIADLRRMKAAGERIAMLTAYDYPSARVTERAELPVVLVGDSLGMVVHGHDSTLPVTLDDMVRHCAAVVRGNARSLIVGDLPFLSYATEADAVRSAGRLMQEGGVGAVKLEGAGAMIGIVAHLTALGVPVMAHLGFTPQSQHQIGLRVQGKSREAARKLVEDALVLEAAGAFSLVLELVPAELAAEISRRLSIPVIGIGAGGGCDGQVQVWHDLLGLFDGKSPRHAKRYAELSAAMEAAVRAYAGEVASGAFPTAAQSASMDAEELQAAVYGLSPDQ